MKQTLELYLEWIRLIECKLDDIIAEKLQEDTELDSASSFLHLAHQSLEDYINGK